MTGGSNGPGDSAGDSRSERSRLADGGSEVEHGESSADGPHADAESADAVPTLFGTSGMRGPFGEEITAETALAIGRAVASTAGERVVIARDARMTGKLLTDALRAGLLECGADVMELGPVSTPTLARTVAEEDADAGVVVTASHNPPADNGIKLWGPDGRAFGEDRRRQIEQTVHEEEFTFAPWDAVGDRTDRRRRALDQHRKQLVEAARSQGDGIADLSVVVDVGNGMGGITARALHEAGCRVHTLNGEPNGRFPGRQSEPTPESCTALRMLVGASTADFGIAHDGDADRMLAVDENGRFISGDRLLALFAADAAEPGDVVTAPLNTSLAVERALESVGAELVRTRVGDVHVAERAVETGAVFAGEASGAWIWPEETTFPDGPLAACKLAAFVGATGSLADAVDTLPAYPIRRDTVELSELEGVTDLERVVDAATDLTERGSDSVGTLDGLRVTTSDGWFLARASGTQPLIRLTAEAVTEQRSQELLDDARSLVERAVVEVAGEVTDE